MPQSNHDEQVRSVVSNVAEAEPPTQRAHQSAVEPRMRNLENIFACSRPKTTSFLLASFMPRSRQPDEAEQRDAEPFRLVVTQAVGAGLARLRAARRRLAARR